MSKLYRDLTVKRLEKLRELNEKLSRIELIIVEEAKKIDQRMRKERLNTSSHFRYSSLNVYLYFFTNYEEDKCVAEWIEGLDDISVGKYNFLSDRGDHNDLHREGHPMKDDLHCWLFHSLHDHKHLSWKTIESINHVEWKFSSEYVYGLKLNDF